MVFRLAVSDSGRVWRVERGKKLLNKDLKLTKSLLPEKMGHKILLGKVGLE